MLLASTTSTALYRATLTQAASSRPAGPPAHRAPFRSAARGVECPLAACLRAECQCGGAHWHGLAGWAVTGTRRQCPRPRCPEPAGASDTRVGSLLPGKSPNLPLAVRWGAVSELSRASPSSR